MGFVVWGLLTALALLAGLALALRVGRRLAIGEQLVAGAVVAVTLVVAPMQVLGYLGVLYPWTVGSVVAALSVALFAGVRLRSEEWRAFAQRRAVACRSALSFGSAAVVLPASALVLYLIAYVWLLPSWSWDALWYHNPIAAYAFQDHSLQWHDTPIPWVNSYPKNIELLALWNMLFAPDDRFVDGVQLPLTMMGVVALATLCRRAGAVPSLAMGLGLVWLLIPAVFLNVPSNYIDASCASLWLVAVLFLARKDGSPAHDLFGTLALGLCAGSKVTGAEHAAMLLVLVGVVLWPRYRGARWVWRFGAVAIGTALLGGATYVRNLWRFGNPVWPVKVAVMGHSLPGTWDLAPLRTPPGGGADDLAAVWRSFFERNPPYMVDVRVGGFGPLFPWVLLPLIVVATALAIRSARRGRTVPAALPIAVLVLTSLATPAAWWGRYTLGLPAAGLIAAAMVFSTLRPRMGQGALAGIAVFAAVQAWPARIGFYGPLDLLWSSAKLEPQARSGQKLFLWQHEWTALREQAMQPGDAAVYDESIDLLYPLWRFDWKNRVLYCPWTDERTWLKQLDDDRARWAAVRRDGPAEAALRSAGWKRLGSCERDACAMWMR